MAEAEGLRVMTPEMWLIAYGFTAGLFIGFIFGILLMCLFAAGGKDDRARGR